MLMLLGMSAGMLVMIALIVVTVRWIDGSLE
jgi:hypothetical protein